MESICISPSHLSGSVNIPPSKSAAHRMIICASLAKGVSKITPVCHSSDIDATIKAVTALGAIVEEKENAFFITGINKNDVLNKKVKIDCGESGSTLRFIIPVAAALGANATFVGHGRLPHRPINELTDILTKNGVRCSDNKLPLEIKGRLKGANYKISGNISSQYLTGLLLAAPLTAAPSFVSLTTPLESAGYIDMTVEIMSRFGVTVKKENNKYTVKNNYLPTDGNIEGDWSQACFFLAASAAGFPIKINGLNPNSLQGDRFAQNAFSLFGGSSRFENNSLIFTPDELTGTEIDCSQIPDMFPALAVTAALSRGKTRLYGASRLRIKESDRIKTTLAGLVAMGISVTELDDGLIITGGVPTGGTVDGAGDHRIVMAFSILATVSKNQTVIKGYNAVNKSYPSFFEDFVKLGGKINVLTNR